MDAIEILDKEATEQAATLNDGDTWGAAFAHYVSSSSVLEATIYGTPTVALCGWVFVPRRDPQRYKVCPLCSGVLEQVEDW
jgi:Protein of unknown function (DUF3039)